MKINKNVLLTCAGFTKCFGGFLGADMRHRLYNIASFENIDELRWPLRESEDYEMIFGQILNDETCSAVVRERVRRVVEDLYGELDHAIESWGRRQQTALRIILENFKAKAEDEKVFHFTLNQDLLLERWWLGGPDISMPGLTRHNGNKVFLSGNSSLKNTHFVRSDDRLLFFLPNEDKWKTIDLDSECTQLTYIKLHGSMNFVSKTHGKEGMVVGSEKTSQIAREPLLNEGYKYLFDRILKSGGVRLLIIGYGFRDENINIVLNAALNKHDLKIFIMDPSRNLSQFVSRIQSQIQRIEKRQAAEPSDFPGFDLLGLRHLLQVSGYFPYDLINDVFPDPIMTDNANWREIQYRYFENRNIRP